MANINVKRPEPRVVFEDDWLVVIDKPAGMVVNRAESVREKTVQDWMEGNFQFSPLCQGFVGQAIFNFQPKTEIDRLFKSRSGVVHRLDKETSGVLVLAKTPEVLAELMRQFRERETKKEYVALVHGRFGSREGSLRVPLGRTSKDRKKFGVVLGGKMTETKYRVVEELGSSNKRYQDGFSVVKLSPKTGRTHQLRVVLKHLGHPIVADSKYLGRKRLKEDLKWCPRLFLHARKLEFVHPGKGGKVGFEAELAEELTEVLSVVQKSQKT